MLQHPMIEKLLAMRLHGMAEGLQAQEQDPAARQLSFLKQLGLLVDQQWNWRQNQAVARPLKEARVRGAWVKVHAECADFGTFTQNLERLSQWLGECNVSVTQLHGPCRAITGTNGASDRQSAGGSPWEDGTAFRSDLMRTAVRLSETVTS